jgi:hypothetical protein
MKNLLAKTAQIDRSPHNDDQFVFAETPHGTRVSLQTICDWAKVRCVVTRAIPLDIRIHRGTVDFVAARPGVRIYCLAERFIPRARDRAGRYILERLAFGANEWSSKEILQADYRRCKRKNATAVTRPNAAAG